MAQRFFSVLGLMLVASVGFAQAFGRFGYEQAVDLPGLKVDKEGFVAADPSADKIRFSTPSSDWKPTETNAIEQAVHLTPRTGCPSEALFSLLGVGFGLYFSSGIDLKVSSVGAPYLSWGQGTVENGVATPESHWLVLSFRNRQPAIVFGFPNAKASLIVTGKSGAWSIRSESNFHGWVKIALPQGLDAPLATTASSLGKLAKIATAHEKLWTSDPPKLLKTSITSDLQSVTATWQFDRPGAIVPPCAQLANLGGYPLSVNSPTVRLPGWSTTGPVDILTGNSLTIRFPVRRIPTGRSLASGTQITNPLSSASPDDAATVTELALESLVGQRDVLTKKTAEATTSEFISEAVYSTEPWTKQQLPFDKKGKGIDLAAAHAFLMQAVTSTAQATSESNSLLTSVRWRQDWLTWRVWIPEEKVSLRAGALAALAGSLCPEPERRLTAAMFQAGISGLRGLDVWKRRKGLISVEPKRIEPLFGIRKVLFGLEGPQSEGEAFAKSLFSPLRIYSDAGMRLVKANGGYTLQCDTVEAKQYIVTLASAYPIEVSGLTNVSYFKLASTLGFTELHFIPEIAGVCVFKLTVPEYGPAPPAAAVAPRYSENEW